MFKTWRRWLSAPPVFQLQETIDSLSAKLWDIRYDNLMLAMRDLMLAKRVSQKDSDLTVALRALDQIASCPVTRDGTVFVTEAETMKSIAADALLLIKSHQEQNP